MVIRLFSILQLVHSVARPCPAMTTRRVGYPAPGVLRLLRRLAQLASAGSHFGFVVDMQNISLWLLYTDKYIYIYLDIDISPK